MDPPKPPFQPAPAPNSFPLRANQFAKTSPCGLRSRSEEQPVLPSNFRCWIDDPPFTAVDVRASNTSPFQDDTTSHPKRCERSHMDCGRAVRNSLSFVALAKKETQPALRSFSEERATAFAVPDDARIPAKSRKREPMNPRKPVSPHPPRDSRKQQRAPPHSPYLLTLQKPPHTPLPLSASIHPLRFKSSLSIPPPLISPNLTKDRTRLTPKSASRSVHSAGRSPPNIQISIEPTHPELGS